MTRTLALTVLLMTPLCHLAAAEKLNVVLIVADDLGWADLGCYGSTYHKTPHLDALAKGGLRFTHGYAACPVCSPTRAALMTGKYPARLNLTDWLPGRQDRPDQRLLRPAICQELPLEEVTLAEALKKAGYATGQIGKWHLGGDKFGPKDQGFDVTVAGDHTGTPFSYFAPFRNAAGKFMPGLEEAPAGEYLTDRLTAEAEKFLAAHKDKPFLLYLPYHAVHTPLRAKKDLVEKYPAGGKPGTQNNPTYAAMIESLDEGVGRVVKKLDELKLADKTVVIFTSDNGGLHALEGQGTPATVNAPLREGKGYLYEGGIRVPLIVRCPGVTKPATVTAVPASSQDVLPTVLDLCGVPADVKVDGVSLRGVLAGGAVEREALYWHYPHYSNQGGRPGGAIRMGEWKLIEFYETGRRELYNVVRDVGEVRNQIEAEPAVAKKLADQLAAWRKEVGAKGMAANPGYVPNPQNAEGVVKLPARHADVRGLQLRYEPAPHKNTLGYWTRAEDAASWEFELKKPGAYTVEVEQGCAKDQGGSEVEVTVAGQALGFTVKDTGGWQAFETRAVGTVKLGKAGRYTLEVKPKTKAGAAVMDLRSVTLSPKP